METSNNNKTKHKPTTPWRPAKLLEIPNYMKENGFVYRFVNKNNIGNIQKKEAEGWVIDKELSKKMKNLQRTIMDGSNLDGTLQIRELIVMKIPKELAEARNEYYEKRSNEALLSANRRYQTTVAEATRNYDQTGGFYGSIDISKGGV